MSPSTIVRSGHAAPRRSRESWAREVADLRASGLTGTAIAARLGLSSSFVYELINDPGGEKVRARKESYRRPCPECGTLMDGANGHGPRASRLCWVCSRAKQHGERVWTPEAVVAAIQRWAQMARRPPKSTEWKRRSTWRDSDGAFVTPAAATVYSDSAAPFSAWSDAIVAAGFPRPHRGGGGRKTGATERMRELAADGLPHTRAELHHAARGAADSLIAWLLSTGELERIAPAVYLATPLLRVKPPEPRPIPASSSDSSTAARAAA